MSFDNFPLGPEMFDQAFGQPWGKRLWRVTFIVMLLLFFGGASFAAYRGYEAMFGHAEMSDQEKAAWDHGIAAAKEPPRDTAFDFEGNGSVESNGDSCYGDWRNCIVARKNVKIVANDPIASRNGTPPPAPTSGIVWLGGVSDGPIMRIAAPKDGSACRLGIRDGGGASNLTLDGQCAVAIGIDLDEACYPVLEHITIRNVTKAGIRIRHSTGAVSYENVVEGPCHCVGASCH